MQPARQIKWRFASARGTAGGAAHVAQRLLMFCYARCVRRATRYAPRRAADFRALRAVIVYARRRAPRARDVDMPLNPPRC
jgi:hypothetical protein